MDEQPEADETTYGIEDTEQVEEVAHQSLILIGPARRLGVLLPADLIGMYYQG